MTATGITSNLSIDETLLLHSIGWEPVDLVFGVSWWSIPWNSWWQPGEVKAASLAFTEAFAEASDDLRRECHEVGGTGVVGVDMDIHTTGTRVSISLTGTAVRKCARAGSRGLRLGSPSSRLPPPRPGGLGSHWACSGSQFCGRSEAHGSGLGVDENAVHGTAAAHAGTLRGEEHAMARLTSSAEASHAHGVVQVKLREGPLGTGMRAVQFVAVGTAIRLRSDAHQRIAPKMVVGLDDAVNLFEATNLRKTVPRGRRGVLR